MRRGSDKDIVDVVPKWTVNELVYSILSLAVLAIFACIMIFLMFFIEINEALEVFGLFGSIVTITSAFVGWYLKTYRDRRTRRSEEKSFTKKWNALQYELGMKVKEEIVTLSQEQIIDLEPQMFRKSGAKWVDFKEHVHPRDEMNKLREKLEQHPFVLLLAKSGAGKTTLVHHLGYRLLVDSPSWFKRNIVSRLRRKPTSTWRFVFSIDLIHGTEFLTGIINDFLEFNRKLRANHSGQSTLLILDNVHLNKEYVREFVKRSSNIFGGSLRCLLVGRSTRIEIEEDKRDWKKLLPEIVCYPLKTDNFNAAVENIVELFLKTREYTLHKIRKTKFLRIINKASLESLMLLRYALISVDEFVSENTKDISKIKRIDVTRAIGKDYDKVIHYACKEVSDTWTEKEDFKRDLRIAFFVIAVLGCLEISVPKEFIRRVLSSQESDETFRGVKVELIGQAIDYLHNRGDLIGTTHSDKLMLPHLSISEVLAGLYSEYDEINRDIFKHLLEGSEKDSKWSTEQACITLLKHSPSVDIIRSVLRGIIFDSETWSREIIKILLRDPELLGTVLSKIFLPHQLIYKLLIESIDETVIVVASAIENHERPWKVIGAITGFVQLVESERIQQAIASAIENHERPWRVIGAITGFVQLVESERIQQAVASVIENHERPWWVMKKITVFVQLVESERIQQAIERATEKIASAIENHDKPWWVIRDISGCVQLVESERIQQAIERATEKIASTIESYNKPWKVIGDITVFVQLVESERIQQAIERATEKIASAIENHERPWWVIRNISGFVQLVESERIQQAVERATEKIASAIENSKYPRKVIRVITGCVQLVESERIQQAVAFAIENYDKPWKVIRVITGCVQLVESERIQQAVASAIENHDEPWWVIRDISGCVQLVESERIQQVVASAIENHKRPWWVIRYITGCVQLVESERIQQAITLAIENHDKPWWVIRDISGCVQLVESERIQQAIERATEKIAFAIENHDEPWKVIRVITGCVQLVKHERVKSAIRSQIDNILKFILHSYSKKIIEHLLEVPVLRESPEIQDAIRQRGWFSELYEDEEDDTQD